MMDSSTMDPPVDMTVRRMMQVALDAWARNDPEWAAALLTDVVARPVGLDRLDQYTALVVLGQCQWEKNFPTLACGYWRRAAVVDPRQSEAATLLAKAARLAGDWAEAFTWASRACADGPSSTDPWWELATAAWWLFGGPVEVGREAVARIASHVRERPDIARLIAQYEITP